MSAYQPFGNHGPTLGPPRELEEREIEVILRLLAVERAEKPSDFPDEYLAMDYVDNLPGSIHLVRRSEPTKIRSLGPAISQASFEDRDGVFVLLSLDADSDGNFYDLDIWKVNDQPIIRWPDPSAISKVETQNSSS